MNKLANNTSIIKNKAKELGFFEVGFSKADFLTSEATKFENWLNNNRHGQMQYMANNFDKRLDPRLLVDGAKTVISLMYNYFTPIKQKDSNGLKISKYAYGNDYHEVIKAKLHELLAWIRENIGEVSGRAFVDSAPVLERAWAAKSGLGWIGKNGNLINKGSGSFYFLSELIIDLPLMDDSNLVTNHCGTCTACIDACPTQAILSNSVIDGSKCISYFTIELKEEIPNSLKGKFENWIFGCDICQDVCPWNRFAKPNNEPQFTPVNEIIENKVEDWIEITEDVFRKVFKKSPLKRTKYNGLKRNIDFILKHD
ncbi:MAG: tRNA epoxyqueuosine(34) reductase QueG [Bacteroidia bacterium]|nr:tRNA epoxyqueuosine(34) reductase QueG [Bacteroidia bacterium]